MKTGGPTGGPTGGQLAMALAAGYLLGRQHRTRLAFMLGAAALTRGLSGFTGQLMRSGTKVLGSSDGLTGGLTGGLGKAAGDVLGETAGKAVPGLGEVGDMIRQDLTSVAKRAVATAISNQIESLSDQLHGRAEAIREQSAGSVKKTARARPEDEEEEEDYEEDRPVQRRRVPRQRDAGNGRAESRSDEPVEAEDEEPAEVEDEEPAERAPRSGAASRGSAASRGGAALRSASRAGRSAQASSPIRRTRR